MKFYVFSTVIYQKEGKVYLLKLTRLCLLSIKLHLYINQVGFKGEPVITRNRLASLVETVTSPLKLFRFFSLFVNYVFMFGVILKFKLDFSLSRYLFTANMIILVGWITLHRYSDHYTN